MAVPLLDVNAQNHPLRAEFAEAFSRVFEPGQFIMGPEVGAFEKEVAPLVGDGTALGVSSGTDALLLAFMALGIGEGDEVLCPAFTFFATAGCVARTGAVPVFVDVCPVCFNLDVADARAKITPRTKAIVPVHLFGQCADMAAILALAEEHSLAVVEDAAQAIGASTLGGRLAGTLGVAGCYSFFPSKNLGGLGDAGLLVVNDPAVAARARAMRNHGMEPKYFHATVGGNFRLDALQAAFLRVKLPHFAAYTEGRRHNAAYYTSRLADVPGVVLGDLAHCCNGSGTQGLAVPEGTRLVLPVGRPGNGHIWNQFTLRVPGGRREELRAFLGSRGIGCEVYYPLTLDQQECFASLPESSRRGCEVAHQLAAEVLSIPIFAELREEQLAEVADALEAFARGST